jgi:hypothetical protein
MTSPVIGPGLCPAAALGLQAVAAWAGGITADQVGWGEGVRASPGEGERSPVEQQGEEAAPHELEEGIEPVEEDQLRSGEPWRAQRAVLGRNRPELGVFRVDGEERKLAEDEQAKAPPKGPATLAPRTTLG